MKKLICAIAFVLAACGGGDPEPDKDLKEPAREQSL